MSGLDLKKLKQNKDEILKAEIGVLLFNLGKTHIGFWKEKEKNQYFQIDDQSFKGMFGFDLFTSYKTYYEKSNETPFDYELDKFNLKDFVYKQKVKQVNNKDVIEWVEFFKGGESKKDFIKKIFFRGCENINSGIDKGVPKEQIKPPLWLSNAFGGFKKKIEEKDFDIRRQCFYQRLFEFLNHENYFSNPNWKEIREFILKEIKIWYSDLLSDSRFPINDVSLWDQAYMSASMFKAVLSQLFMDSSKLNNYLNNPSSIKWRILGIQYDKLGLAEKGFKLASIQWYRETVKKIDDEIKYLLELEYPIGNEIYRDETGIYFIVGEDLGKDNGDFAELNDNLKDIKDEIVQIFKKHLEGEEYPTILLTKASRGLMNLGYLLEKAKENFLKKKSIELPNLEIKDKDKGKAIGICPLCKTRLIYEKDKQKNNSPTICEVCDDRIHHKQVEKWLQNLSSETIWTSEIKDNNDRIALISLKFELQDWLNGNMLNSLLNRVEQYKDFHEKIKDLIKKIKETDWDGIEGFNRRNDKLIKNLLSLYDEGGVIKPYGKITNKEKNLRNILTQPENNLEEDLKPFKELFWRAIENHALPNFGKDMNGLISRIKTYQNNINFNNNNNNKCFTDSNNNILTNLNNKILNLMKDIFSFGYVIMQIKNTLLERSIGDKWENFIKNSLSDPDLIDFENRIINWKGLTDDDIEFLATLLLQFLLRKNPSPARLRRIWESTQEFFEEIKKDILDNNKLGIPDWRRKRLVFEVDYTEDLKQKIKSTGEELEGNGLLFWAQPQTDEKNKINKLKIYLITSIEDFIEKYGIEEVKEKIKNNQPIELNEKSFQEFKIELRKYIENKDGEQKVENNNEEKNVIIKKDNIKELQEYKPYASITDPTPVGWQVIIPAMYVSNFIDLVMEKYNEKFKYVYGKLPIHIGIIFQDYKKPLYIGINALRRIRRDVKDIDKLYINENILSFCIKQKKKLDKVTPEEKINDTEKYYSLYWNNSNNQDYNFYIKPDSNWKKWIRTLDKFNQNDKVNIIPNTFDFEFLDSNTRRNDIFYDENKHYKRAFELKSNRPYEIEVYWEKFKTFKELFKEKSNSAKMHNIINIFYDKLQNYQKECNYLLASAIVNILELNKNPDAKDKIIKIFDLEKDKDLLQELVEKLDEKKIKLFLDMFEFWHKALKEV